MVKNAINVFARVKPEKNRKGVVNYDIHRRPKKHLNEDFLVLNAPQKLTEYIDNRPESWNFSFHRIFEHDVSQLDVFENVARPVVDSVFDGYNATIFAYGQTGSGKTYTISGEPGIHSERGILPRTLQYIFDIVQKNSENLYTVEVAYLEIYNENGYDLLLERNEREAATRLEDLPRVTIQEDENGTMHLKNLSFRIVQNEKEALQFLLDGDTYRAISETPMNPRSSRSHCIFTIVISVKKFGEDRYSRSKMHLVDLAGSERVYKCAIQGTILTEAKHINLSLHFLEQVIVCLGQENVSHVPYRNSLLTSILRDSLGGNCLTTMLATLSVSNFNLEETISTCRFAQRVALVKNDVNLTFEFDAKSENMLLKMENEKLRRQIEELKKQNVVVVSDSGSVEYYKNLVVQRDQEISHLIHLLEKEKSRRKSAIKEMTNKKLAQDEKCIQFPSSRSPRKIDQVSPVESQIKRKRVNSLEEKIRTSRRKSKSEIPEFTENISSNRSTISHIPAIQIPALNLEEVNDLDVRNSQKEMIPLDQQEVGSKTSKIDTNTPITVVTTNENREIKDSTKSLIELKIQTPKIAKLNIIDDNKLEKVYENKKSQLIESPKVLTDRDSQISPKKEKFSVKSLESNESKKVRDGFESLVDQETSKICSNLSPIFDKPDKNQTTESPRSEIERETQTPKNKLLCAKNTENNGSKSIRRKEKSQGKKTPRDNAVAPDIPENVKKMLGTPRNERIKEQNESILPPIKSENPKSGFKTPNILRNMLCIEKNSKEESVDRAEHRRLNNSTKYCRDTNTNNIVRIPLPLTGDPDIDEEIIAFYKAKQMGSLY